MLNKLDDYPVHQTPEPLAQANLERQQAFAQRGKVGTPDIAAIDNTDRQNFV